MIVETRLKISSETVMDGWMDGWILTHTCMVIAL
jgi:hypothetical protein